MKYIQTFILKHSDLITLAIIPIIAGLPHAFNMFNFPYYENDEGVYMSQAWSILRHGKLAPYTYWYDHAPGGWIFIAFWTLLTGGFYTFGFSINSGRVFMLILHIFSALFLYLITIKLTKNKLAGMAAVLIFSLSPLAIYFQRRVLLDNIMTFWLLGSLFFLLHHHGKLRWIMVSAILFAFAILSKENAIFLIPVSLYLIYAFTEKKQTNFALITWLAVTCGITGFYFIYAGIKGELFASNTFLGGNAEHVSLFETLAFQFGRKGGGILNLYESSFWKNMWIWLSEDPVIIIFGAFCTIVNLLFFFRIRAARIAGLLSASLWIFLMRGGLVIEFYIIPLFPILALNIVVFAWAIGSLMKRLYLNNNVPLYIVMAVFIVTSGYFSTNIRKDLNLYTADQTTPQVQAVNWMLSPSSPDGFYVIDNYAYIELHESTVTKPRYAEWYWKVDLDPEVSKTLLKGSAENIDYIALTPQMENDITSGGLNLSKTAWDNAHPFLRFWNDGWGVEFWGTLFHTRMLQSTWDSYKTRFLQDGRIIDPNQNESTTSEGQSYALLRAVWMNDKVTFDEVWIWTQKNLQKDTGLFSWKWEPGQENNSINQGTASDADQDIALALLFASKRWNNSTYLAEAQKILAGIWEHEVVQIQNNYYMTAADWANHEDAITINPSYLSPAWYRIFAAADQSRPWARLVETSYWLLERCTDEKLDKNVGRLPPEWCSVDKQTLTVGQPGEFQPRATEYSYNAFRVPWRVSLDYLWYQAPEAQRYISTLDILSSEYQTKQKISVAYTHDGEVWEDYESVAAYGGNIGYFILTDPEVSKEIYETKILSKFYEDKDQTYWEDPNNYYTQNWAWFGTALYFNQLTNLWK